MTKICQNVKIIFFGLINEFKFDLLAKTRGLYLVPKLRNLNLRKSSCSGVGEPWVINNDSFNLLYLDHFVFLNFVFVMYGTLVQLYVECPNFM